MGLYASPLPVTSKKSPRSVIDVTGVLGDSGWIAYDAGMASKPNRRSHRLSGFDYSRPGAYFLTIKTHDNLPLFGKIEKGIMRLNDMGRVVDRVWHNIPIRFPWVDIDTFQIMPDHVHGIVWIRYSEKMMNKRMGAMDTVRRRGESHSPLGSPLATYTQHERRDPHSDAAKWDSRDRIGEPNCRGGDCRGEWDSPLQRDPRNQSRPTGTSKTVGSIVRGFKIPVTQWARQSVGIRTVWQRDYFDRIIRSQQSLERIRRYIMNNPMKWQNDHDSRIGIGTP